MFLGPQFLFLFLIFYLFLFYFMCMNVLPACLSVHHMSAWCPGKPEEGIRFPRTGVTDGCKTPSVCWELNRWWGLDLWLLRTKTEDFSAGIALYPHPTHPRCEEVETGGPPGPRWPANLAESVDQGSMRDPASVERGCQPRCHVHIRCPL